MIYIRSFKQGWFSCSECDGQRLDIDKQYEPGDRLCGLVVRVLGYRSGSPDSIPGTTRFSGGGGGRKQ
jgi:hypothetical protein